MLSVVFKSNYIKTKLDDLTWTEYIFCNKECGKNNQGYRILFIMYKQFKVMYDNKFTSFCFSNRTLDLYSITKTELTDSIMMSNVILYIFIFVIRHFFYMSIRSLPSFYSFIWLLQIDFMRMDRIICQDRKYIWKELNQVEDMPTLLLEC